VRAWITYAWVDNETADVDYVIQELDAAGVEVRYDRRNIVPGLRLWDQIASEIEDDDCDGWILFTTRAAFDSKNVMEELSYAIDRALSKRGESFPLIALLADADAADLPAGLRVRLGVPLADDDWVERIVAGLLGRTPGHTPPSLEPYVLTVHRPDTGFTDKWCVETRPRAGRWSPAFGVVPTPEWPYLTTAMCGAKDLPTGTGMSSFAELTSEDGAWKGVKVYNEATPTRSLYLYFTGLPTRLRFGVPGGPSWEVALD